MSRATIADDRSTAFVDESMRTDRQGIYVVASVVILDDVARARTTAEKVPPRRRRFHWKDEEDPQRHEMLYHLLELGCGLWSYECRPCPTSKPERARAKCFRSLLWDLRELDVNQLIIESRGSVADRRDARTIGHAMRAREASTALVYEHRRPSVEPALWLADALAGAAAAAFDGHTSYSDRLGNALERKHIDL